MNGGSLYMMILRIQKKIDKQMCPMSFSYDEIGHSIWPLMYEYKGVLETEDICNFLYSLWHASPEICYY